jgi:hydroxymethylpyrimidine pyrophosphatase-like HAD family hydrolase
MKFRALALDYDGTIAEDGVLNPEVRVAIAEVRACGIAVILVTGRILSDLRQVAGELDFVDAVVAENGAVLAFSDHYQRLLASSPPQAFFDELRKRGVQFRVGQCIVESDAASAPKILAVIEELELPLALLFNRGRLMVLPQGLSKSVGLHHALSALHLSVHNTIAIGDAENDHDLLTPCEMGVAVGWGSEALKKTADEVLEGTGPGAVARFIRQMGHEIRLPPDRIGRHRVSLGNDEAGQPVAFAIRGRNLLVSGDPRSGKSWVAGLTCERLILQGYCVCVVDPEGDYRTLESLPGVVVFGGDDPPPQLPDLTRTLRHPEMSAVIDLSRIPYKEKTDYLHSLLPMLASLRRLTGLPHRIVVDEAHYFLHDRNACQLLDLSLNAYTLVTYRLSDLDAYLRTTIEAIIVNRTTDPREVETLLAMAKSKDALPEWTARLASLPLNQAVIMPNTEEAAGKLRRFELSPRVTSHVRHKAKYLDVQLIEEQGFVFTENGKSVGPPARNLKEFIGQLKTCPAIALEGHVRRGDFSRWIAEVFRDRALASDVRKLEQRHRLGHVHDLSNSLAAVVQERYDFSSERLS